MTDSKLKVVICGRGGVGKSALTVMFVQGKFLEEYDPTIEDSYQKSLTVDDVNYNLHILDTAGQEEYAALRDQYMRAGQGFIIVYAINENESFSDLDEFRDQIVRVKDKDNVPIILFGNKCDLKNDRKISFEEGKELAKKWGAIFFEGSAKNRTNLDEAFCQIVREINKYYVVNPAVNEKINFKKEKKKSLFCSIL